MLLFYQNTWVGGWGVVTGNTHYSQISEFTRMANVTVLILLDSFLTQNNGGRQRKLG
jgi:hypothetical protein